jgi:hypothetical protein
MNQDSVKWILEVGSQEYKGDLKLMQLAMELQGLTP